MLFQALSLSVLCQGMYPSEISDLCKEIEYEKILIEDNQIFMRKGEFLRHLTLVLSGCLLAEMTAPSGKTILVDRLLPGRVVAPAFLYGDSHKIPVTLKADLPTSIIRISLQDLQKQLLSNEKFMINFLSLLSSTTIHLSQRINELSLQSLQSNLSRYLLSLSKGQQDSPLPWVVSIETTWEQLARQMGVNRQSIARALSQMEEQGAIDVCGKEIRILDYRKLLQSE